MSQHCSLAIVFLLLAALSGCTATERVYKGEKLSDEEIGHVSTAGAIALFYNKVIYIHKINDLNVGSFVTEAELLPGRHSIKVKMTIVVPRVSASTWGFIDLDVKAGHSYQIDMNFHYIWAEDQATGKVVAGVRPAKS